MLPGVCYQAYACPCNYVRLPGQVQHIEGPSQHCMQYVLARTRILVDSFED
jgi:hypothetical protein